MKTLLLFCLLAVPAWSQSTLPPVGRKAPELALGQALQVPDNRVPRLAYLRGRLVVLEFWATWCGGCVAAIPHLNQTAEQLKNEPIVFLSVTDEDASVVSAFLRKRPMQSWVGLDQDGATFARYGVVARPQTFLLDREGIVRAALQPEQVNAALLTDALNGKYPELPASPGKPQAAFLESQKGAPPPLLQVLVRPAAPAAVSGYSPGAVTASGGRTDYYGLTLAALLGYAENGKPRPDRILAPDWFRESPYDVSVTVPAGRNDLRGKLLRQGLEETFSLRMHREQRPAAVYVLSVADASRLKVSTAKPSNGFTPNRDAFTGVGTSMERLASLLSSRLENVEVINETNLTDRYDFDLAWSGDPASLAAALRSRLGLMLRRETLHREFFVVDRASQPQTW